MNKHVLVVGSAAFVCALDQLTKWYIAHNVPPFGRIPIIDGFFDITHIYNRGAAFGFLNRSDIQWQFWIFLAATVIAIAAIYCVVRTVKNSPFLLTALGCIAGGAIGNLIDRIRWRAVLDFLDFYIASWHWPAFNVADIGICIGVFFTILAAFLSPENGKGAE